MCTHPFEHTHTTAVVWPHCKAVFLVNQQSSSWVHYNTGFKSTAITVNKYNYFPSIILSVHLSHWFSQVQWHMLEPQHSIFFLMTKEEINLFIFTHRHTHTEPTWWVSKLGYLLPSLIAWAQTLGFIWCKERTDFWTLSLHMYRGMAMHMLTHWVNTCNFKNPSQQNKNINQIVKK